MRSVAPAAGPAAGLASSALSQSVSAVKFANPCRLPVCGSSRLQRHTRRAGCSPRSSQKRSKYERYTGGWSEMVMPELADLTLSTFRCNGNSKCFRPENVHNMSIHKIGANGVILPSNSHMSDMLTLRLLGTPQVSRDGAAV